MEYYLNINLDKYDLGKVYYRQGKECIFDPIREKLIIKTPEEEVRQKFIKYLMDVLNVPKNKIEVEVPMSYFKKGAKGRADIIVYEENKYGELICKFIVECKAPSVPIVDEVWYQLYKYNNILCTDLLITTNGIETTNLKKWGG